MRVDDFLVVVTTVLDVAALALVAAGMALGLWPVSGGLALCSAGGVVLAGSALADRPVRAKEVGVGTVGDGPAVPRQRGLCERLLRRP